MTVLLSGWVVLTAVERWGEQTPWPRAALGGLLWSCLVAGVWWFAEWTQSPLRMAREPAAHRSADEAPHRQDAAADASAAAGQPDSAGRPGHSPRGPSPDAVDSASFRNSPRS